MGAGTDLDCKTCWKRDDCPLAMFGYFCPQYQSQKPEPRGEDPNELWRRGEDPEGSLR